MDELSSNLKELVQEAQVHDPTSEQNRHILVGKRVRYIQDEDGEKKTYFGKIISQVSFRKMGYGHVQLIVQAYMGLLYSTLVV